LQSLINLNPAIDLMKVFIKPGCPWCIEVIHWLKDNGYEFDEVNVLADSDAFQEMQRISGQAKTPTMVVGDGMMLADFGVEELVPFIEENDIKP